MNSWDWQIFPYHGLCSISSSLQKPYVDSFLHYELKILHEKSLIKDLVEITHLVQWNCRWAKYSHKMFLRGSVNQCMPNKYLWIFFLSVFLFNTYLNIFLASMLTVLKGVGWMSSFKYYGSRKHFNSTGSTVSVESSFDELNLLHNLNRWV